MNKEKRLKGVGVNFGIRQALVLVLCWALPVALRIFAAPLGREIWILYVIPSALCAYTWSLRGSAVAALIPAALIGATGIFRNESELTAAVLIVGISLFLGLLFERARNKETELRDSINNLQQLVITDPLTGVYNRRYLFDRLGEEVARAKRYGIPVSVIMLDIDSFKTYNDKHGHLTGDVLLQTIAQTIKGALRQEDVVVRYGGDEFAVILTGADARSAKITAERLRSAVKSRGMSISLGVVTYPQDAVVAEELLKRADFYLLAAKAGGKNQVYALES
ncbi:MAG: GGDEF domain-containing protein [Bacillota bacterium]